MGHVTVVGGCRAKAPLTDILASTLPVGSTVKLMEGGTAVEYLVVNQGIPENSSLYDASCDGTWLLRKDCHSSRKWNTSDINNYETSAINTWLNGDFFSSLGSVERTTVKQVKIPYRAGAGYSTTVTSGASGLSCKVFLLSATEVALNRSNMPVNEGSVLSYFNGCASSGADAKRTAEYNGSSVFWWLRSPYCWSSVGSSVAFVITSSGGEQGQSCSSNMYARPALILPKTALFDTSTLILKGVA